MFARLKKSKGVNGIEAARAKLKDALAARRTAAASLAEAEQAIERAKRLLSEADAAEDAADEAQAAAAAATRRWVAGGASPGEDEASKNMAAAAQQADHHAEQLRIRANAAEDALVTLHENEENVRIALQQADAGTKTAVAEILLAALQPQIEAARRAHKELAEARLQIAALYELTRPCRADVWRKYCHQGTANDLGRVLESLALPDLRLEEKPHLRDSEVLRKAEDLAAVGVKLLEDPDIQFHL